MTRQRTRDALLGVLFIGAGSAWSASAAQFVPEEVPPSPLQDVRVLPPHSGTVHGPGAPAGGLKGADPAKAGARLSPERVKQRSDAQDGHLTRGARAPAPGTTDRAPHPGGRFEPGPPVKPKSRSKPKASGE